MRSTNLFALALVALSLSASAVACGGAESSGDAVAPATADGSDEELKAAVIGEESNGKTVDVKLGKSFTIALSENASTGYTWHVQSVDRTLGEPKEKHVAGDVSRPGSPGVHKFTWSTKSPLDMTGKHDITLILQRPWAETSPPAKTFKVTINVLGATVETVCGGLRGAGCSSDSYCEYAASASCGMADQTGKCQAKPQFCPALVMPICGCDGKTYNNSCEANRAGVSVHTDGACAK